MVAGLADVPAQASATESMVAPPTTAEVCSEGNMAASQSPPLTAPSLDAIEKTDAEAQKDLPPTTIPSAAPSTGNVSAAASTPTQQAVTAVTEAEPTAPVLATLTLIAPSALSDVTAVPIEQPWASAPVAKATALDRAATSTTTVSRPAVAPAAVLPAQAPAAEVCSERRAVASQSPPLKARHESPPTTIPSEAPSIACDSAAVATPTRQAKAAIAEAETAVPALSAVTAIAPSSSADVAAVPLTRPADSEPVAKAIALAKAAASTITESMPVVAAPTVVPTEATATESMIVPTTTAEVDSEEKVEVSQSPPLNAPPLDAVERTDQQALSKEERPPSVAPTTQEAKLAGASLGVAAPGSPTRSPVAPSTAAQVVETLHSADSRSASGASEVAVPIPAAESSTLTRVSVAERDELSPAAVAASVAAAASEPVPASLAAPAALTRESVAPLAAIEESTSEVTTPACPAAAAASASPESSSAPAPQATTHTPVEVLTSVPVSAVAVEVPAAVAEEALVVSDVQCDAESPMENSAELHSAMEKMATDEVDAAAAAVVAVAIATAASSLAEPSDVPAMSEEPSAPQLPLEDSSPLLVKRRRRRFHLSDGDDENADPEENVTSYSTKEEALALEAPPLPEQMTVKDEELRTELGGLRRGKRLVRGSSADVKAAEKPVVKMEDVEDDQRKPTAAEQSVVKVEKVEEAHKRPRCASNDSTAAEKPVVKMENVEEEQKRPKGALKDLTTGARSSKPQKSKDKPRPLSLRKQPVKEASPASVVSPALGPRASPSLGPRRASPALGPRASPAAAGDVVRTSRLKVEPQEDAVVDSTVVQSTKPKEEEVGDVSAPAWMVCEATNAWMVCEEPEASEEEQEEVMAKDASTEERIKRARLQSETDEKEASPEAGTKRAHSLSRAEAAEEAAKQSGNEESDDEALAKWAKRRRTTEKVADRAKVETKVETTNTEAAPPSTDDVAALVEQGDVRAEAVGTSEAAEKATQQDMQQKVHQHESPKLGQDSSSIVGVDERPVAAEAAPVASSPDPAASPCPSGGARDSQFSLVEEVPFAGGDDNYVAEADFGSQGPEDDADRPQPSAGRRPVAAPPLVTSALALATAATAGATISVAAVPKGPGAPAQRILVCGDLAGRLDLLHHLVDDIASKGAPVNFVLCVGRFLSEDPHASFTQYLGRNPEKKMPVPVYFIDQASKDFIRHSEKTGGPVVLQEWLVFLGGCGVAEIQGVRIAFLSGGYEEFAFATIWGTGCFHNEHYTLTAVEEIKKQVQEKAPAGVDVLLTSEWPDVFWSTAFKKEAPSPVAAEHRSPAVRTLFFDLKPRYHVCAAAGLYRYRKAEQGPHSFVCSSVALARATEDLQPQDIRDRWHHVLTIHPRADDEAIPKMVLGPCRLVTQMSSATPAAAAAAARKPPSRPKRSVVSQYPEVGLKDKRFIDLLQKHPPSHDVDFKALCGGPKKQLAISNETAKKDVVTASERKQPAGNISFGTSVVAKAPQPTVAQSCSDERLPPGWELGFSRTYNKPYYVERATGRTQWLPPVAPGVKCV
eukprot:TRINITY_DN32807_c0_g1_i1.p1 TRINITY_DN32807_c0_g1~~TRINITY_DN32807_c0_g1_i1.p1  ORF type:complete len:1768 (+),score=417.37 TRINITY_DN32807_c0_g1_i1:663-5306(+)